MHPAVGTFAGAKNEITRKMEQPPYGFQKTPLFSIDISPCIPGKLLESIACRPGPTE
jgi:hypothetical protein